MTLLDRRHGSSTSAASSTAIFAAGSARPVAETMLPARAVRPAGGRCRDRRARAACPRDPVLLAHAQGLFEAALRVDAVAACRWMLPRLSRHAARAALLAAAPVQGDPPCRARRRSRCRRASWRGSRRCRRVERSRAPRPRPRTLQRIASMALASSYRPRSSAPVPVLNMERCPISSPAAVAVVSASPPGPRPSRARRCGSVYSPLPAEARCGAGPSQKWRAWWRDELLQLRARPRAAPKSTRRVPSRPGASCHPWRRAWRRRSTFSKSIAIPGTGPTRSRRAFRRRPGGDWRMLGLASCDRGAPRSVLGQRSVANWATRVQVEATVVRDLHQDRSTTWRRRRWSIR